MTWGLAATREATITVYVWVLALSASSGTYVSGDYYMYYEVGT